MSKWIVSLPDSRVVFDNRGEAEEYVEEWIDSDDHELTAEYEPESEQTEWMWLVEVHPYDSRHRQETITLHEAEYHGDGRSGVLEGKYEFLRADRNKLRKVARRRQEQLLKAPLAIEESLQDPNTLYQICEAHYEPLSDEMPDKFEDTRYAHYLEKERSRTSAGGDDFAVPTIDKPPDNLRMFLSTLFAREPIFPNLSTNRVINLHQPCSGRRFAGGPVLSRPILWHHPRHVFPVPVPR